MRLVYLKDSLEISRANGFGDELTLWNCYGVPGIVDGSTRALETIRAIKKGEIL